MTEAQALEDLMATLSEEQILEAINHTLASRHNDDRTFYLYPLPTDQPSQRRTRA